MDTFEDTWRDRHYLSADSYGLNAIYMLTVQTVAYYAYRQLTPEKKEMVEKLIIRYQRPNLLKSKNRSALIIEEICNLINPNHENAFLNFVLDSCCHRNSFYGHFGLDHVFAVIFLPILVSSITWQKKYYVSIASAHDENWGEKHSLFQILKIHHEILKWHETKGKSEVHPIFRFGEDFVKNATVETAKYSNSSVEDELERYQDVQLNYGRVS